MGGADMACSHSTHTSLVIDALQLDIAAADKDLGHAILEVKVRLLECKQANQAIKTMITSSKNSQKPRNTTYNLLVLENRVPMMAAIDVLATILIGSPIVRDAFLLHVNAVHDTRHIVCRRVQWLASEDNASDLEWTQAWEGQSR